MWFRQGNDPAAAPVTGGKPGLGFQLGDLFFQRNESVELELLLVRPAVRHMRHQCAQQPAACTISKTARFQQQGVYAHPLCLDGSPQPHNAATDDEERHRARQSWCPQSW
ncbi:hypothetical protein D3C87_1582110 [compost metagenome]